MPDLKSPTSSISMAVAQVTSLTEDIQRYEVRLKELEGVKNFISIEASVKSMREEKQRLGESILSHRAELAALEKKEFELPAVDAQRIEEIEQTAKDLLETFRQKALTVRKESKMEAKKLLRDADDEIQSRLRDEREEIEGIIAKTADKKRLITKRQKELTACELELNHTEARLVTLKREITRREKKIIDSQEEVVKGEVALSVEADRVDKVGLKLASDRAEFERESHETLKRFSTDRETLNYQLEGVKKQGRKMSLLQEKAEGIDLNVSELNTRSGELDSKEVKLNTLEETLNERVKDIKKQQSDLAEDWLVHKKAKKKLDLMLKKLVG